MVVGYFNIVVQLHQPHDRASNDICRELLGLLSRKEFFRFLACERYNYKSDVNNLFMCVNSERVKYNYILPDIFMWG